MTNYYAHRWLILHLIAATTLFYQSDAGVSSDSTTSSTNYLKASVVRLIASPKKKSAFLLLPLLLHSNIRGGAVSSSNTDPLLSGAYEIVKEQKVYKGWRIVSTRSVLNKNTNKTIDYDVVGQAGGGGAGGANNNVMMDGAAIVFSWDTRTKTATLIREYNPGPHQVLYGLAAGLVENDKHGANYQTAAAHEMEEEIHQSGGTWYALTDEPIAMDKYATTKIQPYLVIDAHHVENPKPCDEEEDIEIVYNVTREEIIGMITRSEMNLVGACTSLMAFAKLAELGEL